MVFMCWNLYMWIVLETSLRVDYKEVVSVAMENGSLCDGKATPDQANSATKFVSIY
ncbi:hypothetical protein DPMN_018191 [Dreissena polymorpha]|uniref:Uncharacterized protein n=1 Tax=Dreissena polymorpha TaxID=45954 RepID=A0A9D4NIA0_DREPO|nr:hypothetical protein DPMN_018191 [Dreissena polymorpha]